MTVTSLTRRVAAQPNPAGGGVLAVGCARLKDAGPAVVVLVSSILPPGPAIPSWAARILWFDENHKEDGMSYELSDDDFRRIRNYDPQWAVRWFERFSLAHAYTRGDEGFTGWIYFIQARQTDPIKIGYAGSDVKSRVQNLQVAWPYTLNILCTTRGDQRMEQFLHHTFAHYRLRGEWFRAKAFGLGDLIDYFNSRLPV